ncbi:MAG: hypothetical protein AAFV80_13865, partial [Bacteroidota bacterium]
MKLHSYHFQDAGVRDEHFLHRTTVRTAWRSRCGFAGLFILLLLTANLSSAADITWTNGAGTGIWSDAGNWDSGTVPGAGDHVFFDSG